MVFAVTFSRSCRVSLSTFKLRRLARASSRSFSTRLRTACAASDDLTDFGDRTTSRRSRVNSSLVWETQKVFNRHNLKHEPMTVLWSTITMPRAWPVYSKCLLCLLYDAVFEFISMAAAIHWMSYWQLSAWMIVLDSTGILMIMGWKISEWSCCHSSPERSRQQDGPPIRWKSAKRYAIHPNATAI